MSELEILVRGMLKILLLWSPALLASAVVSVLLDRRHI